MRPVEILLWLADLAMFAVLVTPRFRGAWWLRYLALATGAVAGAQVLVEGPRWEMYPAYGLAGLFVLGWALRDRSGLARPGRWHGPRAWAGAALGVLALALALALPLALPVFHLPEPAGPYGVGTVTYHLVDASRGELFTADPADKRELMVQVWYPARTSPTAPRVRYLQDGASLAPLARLLRLPGFTLDHLKYVTTNAVAAAPMVEGTARYPVLVFSHGRGGYRQHNSFQIEALVAHGYVVAAIDHPYVAAEVVFPDGRKADIDRRMIDGRFKYSIIPYLAQDVGFTLDQLAAVDRADPNGILTGRLDLARAGMFGVSLGGAVTAEACAHDPRLRACLPIDVFMPADVAALGLRQPTLWISRDAATMHREGWSVADIAETQDTMRSAFARSSGPAYLVLVPGAFHTNFSDAPLLAARPLGVALGLIGPADPARVHAIVNAATQAFFDRYLKDAPGRRLDDLPKAFPEVRYERRP